MEMNDDVTRTRHTPTLTRLEHNYTHFSSLPQTKMILKVMPFGIDNAKQEIVDVRRTDTVALLRQLISEKYGKDKCPIERLRLIYLGKVVCTKFRRSTSSEANIFFFTFFQKEKLYCQDFKRI